MQRSVASTFVVDDDGGNSSGITRVTCPAYDLAHLNLSHQVKTSLTSLRAAPFSIQRKTLENCQGFRSMNRFHRRRCRWNKSIHESNAPNGLKSGSKDPSSIQRGKIINLRLGLFRLSPRGGHALARSVFVSGEKCSLQLRALKLNRPPRASRGSV